MATVKSDQDLNWMLIYLLYAIRICVNQLLLYGLYKEDCYA